LTAGGGLRFTGRTLPDLVLGTQWIVDAHGCDPSALPSCAALGRLFARIVGELDLAARLRSAYETSIVPGRFFGAEQHFRIGIGGESSMVRAGLLRLGRALDDQHHGTVRLPPT
jgi:hypothetical protein